jgi:hypothetical protein
MQTLKALAVGMPGVPPGFFEEYHDEGDNQLRLLHCQSLLRIEINKTDNRPFGTLESIRVRGERSD